MTQRVYTYTDGELTQFANQVKDLIADKLNIKNLDNYVVVVHYKGMLGRAWDAIWDKAPGSESTSRIELLVMFKDKEPKK